MRVLMIWPKFTTSFYSYNHIMHLTSRKAVHPPVGLLTVAALLPQDWEFRVVDANAYDITEDDWAFPDMVMLSGLITQKRSQFELIAECNRRNLPVAVGGTCATSIPEETKAAGADFLVLNEGEITIPFFLKALAEGATSGTFVSDGVKADMTTSPIPRFDLINMKDYWQPIVQFSRGCPFHCEFCDIPAMFGHRPRTKTPEQFQAELQVLLDMGWQETIMIGDDNFIGHKKNVIPLLESLVEWQRERGYPFGFATEASLNLADDPKLLALLRDAGFKSLFLGIETPDEDTLFKIHKKQNLRKSMRDRLHKMYAHGFRIAGGMIIGFDGEKPGADQRILDFMEEMSIPLVILNMLYAMPNTPLTERLIKQDRIIHKESFTGICLSNFVPTRPLTEVAGEYLSCLVKIVEMEPFLDRVHRNCLLMGPKATKKLKSIGTHPRDIYGALVILWRHGLLRRTRFKFWKLALDVYRKNPRAIRRYFNYCAEYEHLLGYSRDVVDYLETDLNSLGDIKHQVYQDPGEVPVAV